jgi:uncharacterized membrane protein
MLMPFGAQSEVEYLVTYDWALILITIVLAIMYYFFMHKPEIRHKCQETPSSTYFLYLS